MRLHLAGLPHTSWDDPDTLCGYTRYSRLFTTMMRDRGHEVLVYWGEPDGDPAVHWPTAWSEFNARTRERIYATLQSDDIVCLAGGASQATLLDLPAIACEHAVGYEGVCAPHRAFASYAWMHYHYGRAQEDGRFYDTVIPHAVDPDAFHIDNPGDYFLYLGRVASRKGVQVAIEATGALDARLIVAGPESDAELPDHVEYAGEVSDTIRAGLLARARAVFMPTTYVEPFGMVAVEAMMSGCPTITTDWGAFTETVTPQVGFRCRTLAEFTDAARHAGDLDRPTIRATAIGRYSPDLIAGIYDAWFARLRTLHSDGWYTKSEAA